MKFTPFRLLYGAEAMSPEERKHKSLRTQNNIEPLMETDLMDLDILQASDNLIFFGDWVLKRKPNSKTIGKLQSKWNDPYLVLYSNRPGSYHLADLEGNAL